ncbi:MAG: hypothetical protein U0840_27565 [Gemmataceae bacterium]
MHATRAAMIAFTLLAVGTVGLAADSQKPVHLKGHTKAVTTVVWAADGKSLATAGDDRTVRVWHPVTGQQKSSLPEIAREGYGGPVVAITPDFKIVAVNYWGEITVFSMADGKELVKIDPILDRGQQFTFRPDVYAMALSPDGKQLATAGSVAAVGGRHGLPGGIVVVWDVKTGKIIHRSEKLSTAASSVAWSKDGKLIAAGTNGAGGELPEAGEIRVCEADSGKLIHNFMVKSGVNYGEWASAGDVVFSPDSEHVAVPVTAGSRGTPAGLLIKDTGASVRVWDLRTSKARPLVEGLKVAVKRVAFSPDGKRLATASNDKVIRVWDTRTGKEVVAMKGTDHSMAIAFSPDGKSLAVGNKDGSAWVYAVPPAK